MMYIYCVTTSLRRQESSTLDYFWSLAHLFSCSHPFFWLKQCCSIKLLLSFLPPMIFFRIFFFTPLVWTDAAASRWPPSSGIRCNASHNAEKVNYINAKSTAESVPSSERLQTLMYITSSGKFGVFGPTIVMNGFMKEVAPWPCSPLGATFSVLFRLFKHRHET